MRRSALQVCVWALTGSMAAGPPGLADEPKPAAAWREDWRRHPRGLLASEPLAEWSDTTQYARVYHVAQGHPRAGDDGPGTAERPFVTIARAAERLQPGEKVVVHAGVYRECVRPARGGTGPDRMIAYEAAKGEDVVITALEPVTGPLRPVKLPVEDERLDGVSLWRVDFPLAAMAGYNPFTTPNQSSRSYLSNRATDGEKQAYRRLRGRVFADGKPLAAKDWPGRLQEPGSYWLIDGGRGAVVHLPEGQDAASARLEISAREQCFAPVTWGLPWIRVSGFVMADAANAVPMPQRGALSARGGAHWIIEHNTILRANTIGMDIGWGEVPHRYVGDEGGHIVRGNRVVGSGLCGLCGTSGVRDSLIVANRFEDTGGLGLEWCFEAAAMKFHWARRMVIRDNLIVGSRSCAGIWLDWSCFDNRVSSNTIVDTTSLLGAIYIEASDGPQLIDGNRIWLTRDRADNHPPKDGIPGGLGISVDVSNHCVIVHNLIGGVEGHAAIACHLAQKDRKIRLGDAGGPTGAAACSGMQIADNVVLDCAGVRVRLARLPGNTCDRNRYGPLPKAGAFLVEESGRHVRYGFPDWQKSVKLDLGGREVEAKAEYADGVLTLTGKALAAGSATDADIYPGPGPFTASERATLAEGGGLRLVLVPDEGKPPR